MSDLLKAKRLVDGDDLFRWRVEAACWARGVEFAESVVRSAAFDESVLAAADLDEFGTIDSSNVPDEAILDAVAAVAAGAVEEQPPEEAPE